MPDERPPEGRIPASKSYYWRSRLLGGSFGSEVPAFGLFARPLQQQQQQQQSGSGHKAAAGSSSPSAGSQGSTSSSDEQELAGAVRSGGFVRFYDDDQPRPAARRAQGAQARRRAASAASWLCSTLVGEVPVAVLNFATCATYGLLMAIAIALVWSTYTMNHRPTEQSN